MAGNNNIELYTAGKDTFPRSTTLTGTMSAVNGLNKKIVGVGTLFTTELAEGMWLFIPGEDEVIKIENIVNDLELTVNQGFTNGFTGEVGAQVPRSSYRSVSWLVDTLTATVDGVPFTVGKGNGNEIQSTMGKSELDPIVIDATGDVTVSYRS